MTEEERRKKLMLVKILVASLAVIIFLFWFLNLKNVLKMNNLRSQQNPEAAKWGELKQEIGDSLDEVTQKLNDQEQQAQLEEDVNGILNGVMAEAGKIASSSSATSSEANFNASSTATTSSSSSPSATIPEDASKNENNNCPSYIDCMPTIGEAKPCQVPAGCEGITQIAY
jgi:cell division protein FtsB